MTEGYDRIKTFRKKVREDLINIFGGKCVICGYKKYLSAFEFHHVDPSEKEFSIGSYKVLNKEKILEESKKCVLVCCNCHNAIHANEVSVVLTPPSLDEKLISQFLNPSNKEYDFCPICGQRKDAQYATCSLICSNLKKEKVNWKTVDLKSLLLEKKGWEEIGRLLGVSGTTVKKHANRLNLIEYYKSSHEIV